MPRLSPALVFVVLILSRTLAGQAYDSIPTTVTGRAVNEQGEPVRANVTLEQHNGARLILAQVVCDKDGKFQIYFGEELWLGGLSLAAYHEDLFYVGKLELKPARTTDVGTVVLKRAPTP